MKSQFRKKQLLTPDVLASLTLVVMVGATAFWTWTAWKNRPSARSKEATDSSWHVTASESPQLRGFFRTQDTSFWLPLRSHSLRSNGHLASGGATLTARHVNGLSRVTLGSDSILHLDSNPDSFRIETSLLPPDVVRVTLLSGAAKLVGPLVARLPQGETAVASGDTKIVSVTEDVDQIRTDIVGEMTPAFGSHVDVRETPQVQFTWKEVYPQATIEFARDSMFRTVLFKENADQRNFVNVSFADRGAGPWFARVKNGSAVVALTSFTAVESRSPTAIRMNGKRWLTWKNSGQAPLFRIEFSTSDDFSSIDHSATVQSALFDLSKLGHTGKSYVRVVGIDGEDKESPSRPYGIEIPSREEILRAQNENGDPELRLYAKGWRIQLTHTEVKRIREGYVILRESELRGIKVADSVRSELSDSPASFIFEVSRDEEFSNPERVRPTARGELLPPALPLGIIFARLRRIETDGTFGAFGPASRISTWLPAPIKQKSVRVKLPDDEGILVYGSTLNWFLSAQVAGYELRISSSKDFAEATTLVTQTRAAGKFYGAENLDHYFWTVTAIDKDGRPVSATSEIFEETNLLPRTLAGPKRTTSTEVREPAAKIPLLPILESPLEDAIVVGGARANRYGKLKWTDATASEKSRYDVEIASDRDFVNNVERATVEKREYPIQGDLPEGALFWRVRKHGVKEWSEARRFELVYE